MSLESLTEALRQRAAQNPKLGYKVKFALDDGGVIFWEGTGDQAAITNSDGEADTTMRLSEENLEKLLAGNLDPTMAYMTGKLKVEGRMGVALKIDHVGDRPRPTGGEIRFYIATARATDGSTGQKTYVVKTQASGCVESVN